MNFILRNYLNIMLISWHLTICWVINKNGLNCVFFMSDRRSKIEPWNNLSIVKKHKSSGLLDNRKKVKD